MAEQERKVRMLTIFSVSVTKKEQNSVKTFTPFGAKLINFPKLQNGKTNSTAAKFPLSAKSDQQVSSPCHTSSKATMYAAVVI